MLAEGSSAPDFRLGGWSLGEALKKGPVLLAFFKISCPTCQFAMPFVQRLADAAGPGTPEVVAISQDDAKGTGQFAAHFGIRIPALIDAGPSYAVSNLYRLQNVPTLYLVEPDGRISLAVAGFSKAHLEKVGEQFGGSPFRPGEQVPAMRPG